MPRKPTPLLRLPLKIKSIPGGYAISGKDDAKPRIYIYGDDDPGRRSAGNLLSRVEAKALAQEIARALTERWTP